MIALMDASHSARFTPMRRRPVEPLAASERLHACRTRHESVEDSAKGIARPRPDLSRAASPIGLRDVTQPSTGSRSFRIWWL